jgi:hypothetical protein
VVRGRLFRLALCALLPAGLASCELVIGGESHAVIQSRDGAAEAATDATPPAPDTSAPGPDTAMPDVHTGPPGPCVVPPPCMQSEQTCGNDCTQQYNLCQLGHGNPHDEDCKTDFADCTTTCQSTCIACADCAQPAPACMVP